MTPSLSIRQFASLQPYSVIFEQMQEYTRQRSIDSPNALWFLEHEPVFTQGQAGKPEHILSAGNIPIVQSDRGGQVTYHGPGQLMIYALYDLKQLSLGLKDFVSRLENSIIMLLKKYDIPAATKNGAPGVYVADQKICSLGLRVRKGCTYHGMSLNVNMDLAPFTQINPCGFSQLTMTQIADFVPKITLEKVTTDLLPILEKSLS
jgi:lipoyl(octanoyl) transferase